MPQIIVIADQDEKAPVLLRERINPSDFESELFGRHLVERLGWAVKDAREVEDATAVEQSRPGQNRDPRELAPQRSARVVTTAS